jgi:hypothetical protein
VAFALAGCGSASHETVPELKLAEGERVESIPTHDPLQQAVAVVFLMPETELAVDVVSGRLFAPAAERGPDDIGPHNHEALIGLMDPQLHDQIFSYRSNGIPGLAAWDPSWGAAPSPAPGELPAWTPPRLVTRSGRPLAVLLADGQRVGLVTDGRRRIVQLHWATPRGESLLTTIRYERGETTVSGPAGVVRSYHYNDRDRITEVDAPDAGAHARDDTADGLLDSRATALHLDYRLRSGTPERYAAYAVAPNAINQNFLDWADTDGYQRYAVPTLADMRTVDQALRASGVLDVAEAMPVLNNRLETYADEKDAERVTAGLRPCHIATGEYRFTYGGAITSGEIAEFAQRLPRIPRHWIYIYYDNARSVGCGEPL